MWPAIGQLQSGPGQHPRIDLAWDQLPCALRANHPAILYHYLAAQHGEDRPAVDLPTFPDTVVADVEVRHAQHLVERGINEDDIGIAARRNRALAGIQAEQPRGVR